MMGIDDLKTIKLYHGDELLGELVGDEMVFNKERVENHGYLYRWLAYDENSKTPKEVFYKKFIMDRYGTVGRVNEFDF